ncbi:MAG: septum formation protein Maf [Saprospiraceae bacterium]|nr:septum formation protein Maf [Saprospiraceae bacterium]
MHPLIKNYKLILGSKSPRRVQLLQESGFDFEVFTTDVEEEFHEEMPGVEVPTYLAKVKADAIFATRKFSDDEILLTADSVVILDNVIYGKPMDAQDARAMLSKLSGKQHTVITGCCLKNNSKELCFQGVSEVKMADLDENEINYYIEKYQPFDKAGSYAVQEWIGLCKISSIEGTYSNIMGLPTFQLFEHLKTFII